MPRSGKSHLWPLCGHREPLAASCEPRRGEPPPRSPAQRGDEEAHQKIFWVSRSSKARFVNGFCGPALVGGLLPSAAPRTFCCYRFANLIPTVRKEYFQVDQEKNKCTAISFKIRESVLVTDQAGLLLYTSSININKSINKILLRT